MFTTSSEITRGLLPTINETEETPEQNPQTGIDILVSCTYLLIAIFLLILVIIDIISIVAY